MIRVLIVGTGGMANQHAEAYAEIPDVKVVVGVDTDPDRLATFIEKHGIEPGIGLADIREGTSLSEVIAGLNSLGVAPRDMIDILKSIKASGALHAEFIVR